MSDAHHRRWIRPYVGALSARCLTSPPTLADTARDCQCCPSCRTPPPRRSNGQILVRSRQSTPAGAPTTTPATPCCWRCCAMWWDPHTASTHRLQAHLAAELGVEIAAPPDTADPDATEVLPRIRARRKRSGHAVIADPGRLAVSPLPGGTAGSRSRRSLGAHRRPSVSLCSTRESIIAPVGPVAAAYRRHHMTDQTDLADDRRQRQRSVAGCVPPRRHCPACTRCV